MSADPQTAWKEPGKTCDQSNVCFHVYNPSAFSLYPSAHKWTPESAASVSRFTLSQAVPHLIKLFHNPDEISNRSSVLSLLGDLIEAARVSTVVISADEPPLANFKDETLGVFIVGLKTSNSRKQALDGLKSMVKTQSLLSDEELGFIVHNANEGLQDEDSDETRSFHRYWGYFRWRGFFSK